MTNKITFQLDEGTCSRLALYTAKRGLDSWGAAIEDMLARCEGASASAPAAIAPPKTIAQLRLRSPLVIYYADGESVSERECLSAIIAAGWATVRIHYADGGAEDKQWIATRMQEDSYLRGNLNSGYLRRWRERGIVKAEIFPGEAE